MYSPLKLAASCAGHNMSMQIFIVTSSGNMSGGTRQALYQARGLLERGHEVTVFSPPGAKAKEFEPDLPWGELPPGLGQWKKSLEARLDKKHPCVVHAYHNKGIKLISALGLYWRLKGLPIACLGHRGVVYPPRNPLPYLSPGMRAFTTNSAACAAILRRMSLGLKPVEVIYNAIPDERVRPARSPIDVRWELGIPEDAFVVGTVAHSAAVKGVQVLLPAFAAAYQSGMLLLTVGAEPEKWAPMLQDLGIAEQARMVPKTNQVADYLQIMDFFVLPSLSESQPNTLLEAMCLGLPAGGSAVGGVPELIHNPALLVPPNDPAALAGLIRRAFEQPELLRIAAQDNAKLSAQFTLQARLDKLEALYAALLRPFESQTVR